jgi:hypothetical protein
MLLPVFYKAAFYACFEYKFWIYIIFLHSVLLLHRLEYLDLVPCDFFLFLKLKTHLKVHHFGTVQNVQAAATRALNNFSSEDFLHCYEEWQQRWNRCIRSQGAYFKGDKL